MRGLQRIAFAVCVAAILICAPALSTTTAQTNSASKSETVACSVLEVHSLAQPAVTVVIFHQRDKSDQARLGDLLRQRSDSAAEFQTTDGAWHTATVVRLKSCFGRGLLVFSASSVHFAERATFVLKFSPNSAGA